MSRKQYDVRIEETGNGYPEVGDTIDTDMGVVHVVSVRTYIHTSPRPWGRNYVLGQVEWASLGGPATAQANVVFLDDCTEAN